MAGHVDDIRRYYEVLDLEPGASKVEVEQAYREMAKIWHPDRFSDDPRLHKRTEQKMKEINEAREGILAHLEHAGPRASRTDGGPTPAGRPVTDLRLPPWLLKYAVPSLLLLLALLSRVPTLMALAILLLIAVVLFFPSRKD